MSDLIQTVTNKYTEKFGCAPQKVIQAPGRVNLIGEHTDYNDGFVLPCAINFQTVVVAGERDDNQFEVMAVDYDCEVDVFSIDTEITPSPYHWANYIRGVVKEFVEKGYISKGANIVVSGNVPHGAGLSSSASLEVAIGQTLKSMNDLSISQTDIALIAQKAENEFVGCQCGILDQLISAEAKEQHALLIDCRTLKGESIPLPDGYSVVIVNSNKKRGLVDSEYNTRRQQCEEAASFFKVKALRDVTITQFEDKKPGLDPLTAKRAKHIITENERTLLAGEALKKDDMHTLQRLMAESHQSMKDDFEITVPEIDTLVDMIKDVIGESGGVRMTGGGFGGCIVSIVPNDLVEQVKHKVEEQYEKLTGLKASIYVCEATAGASEITHV